MQADVHKRRAVLYYELGVLWRGKIDSFKTVYTLGFFNVLQVFKKSFYLLTILRDVLL